jgi:hypothetical protein
MIDNVIAEIHNQQTVAGREARHVFRCAMGIKYEGPHIKLYGVDWFLEKRKNILYKIMTGDLCECIIYTSRIEIVPINEYLLFKSTRLQAQVLEEKKLTWYVIRSFYFELSPQSPIKKTPTWHVDSEIEDKMANGEEVTTKDYHLSAIINHKTFPRRTESVTIRSPVSLIETQTKCIAGSSFSKLESDDDSDEEWEEDEDDNGDSSDDGDDALTKASEPRLNTPSVVVTSPPASLPVSPSISLPVSVLERRPLSLTKIIVGVFRVTITSTSRGIFRTKSSNGRIITGYCHKKEDVWYFLGDGKLDRPEPPLDGPCKNVLECIRLVDENTRLSRKRDM